MRKIAAMARETQEYLRNSQSQNSAAPRITEDFIAQVSEQFEGRVTKKLSQELSRRESRILVALSKLDKFPLNPQIRTISGTVPGSFLNADVENQQPSGDPSQNDYHSEIEFSASHVSYLNDSVPEETTHRFSFPCTYKHFSISTSITKCFFLKNLWIENFIDIFLCVCFLITR